MADVNKVWDFAYTGKAQTFQAEDRHMYYLECYGASGGNGGGDSAGPNRDLGGKGGFAKGYYTNYQATTWTIQVGGKGGDGNNAIGGAGGYYLGGKGGDDGDNSDYETGGGGGGATTINQFLTAGGGSGGGSPNSSVLGADCKDLHNGKGSGGAGGPGYNTAGANGGVVNGGTASSGGVRPSEPGKNYIGGVIEGTHGTNPNKGHGSAKITCVAKAPTMNVIARTNNSITIEFYYNNTLKDKSKLVVALINEKTINLHSTTSNSTEKYVVTLPNIPDNFDGSIMFKINNGIFTESFVVKYDNKPPKITFAPNFTSIKWYQDIPNEGVFTILDTNETDIHGEIQYYINGELHEAKTIKDTSIKPPLLYSPLRPKLWEYQMYVKIRVKQRASTPNGTTQEIWSDWVTSPTINAQYNVAPTNVEFGEDLCPYYLINDTLKLTWNEASDINNTDVEYSVTLIHNEEILQEWKALTSNELTIPVPNRINRDLKFNVVAYSGGLYSNSSYTKTFAITDVNNTDCTLNFPVLTTNVTGEFSKLSLIINGDEKIVKTENFVDYTIPVHYFRKGINKLTLLALDRNNVEITRTWNVNLNFNMSDLVNSEKINVKGLFSFNYDPQEIFHDATELRHHDLDLGVVEHELYGSTPFEGSNTVTQKLVLTRQANDDDTQVRTIKITGAIE